MQLVGLRYLRLCSKLRSMSLSMDTIRVSGENLAEDSFRFSKIKKDFCLSRRIVLVEQIIRRHHEQPRSIG